jgi:hypothetical protein
MFILFGVLPEYAYVSRTQPLPDVARSNSFNASFPKDVSFGGRIYLSFDTCILHHNIGMISE